MGTDPSLLLGVFSSVGLVVIGLGILKMFKQNALIVEHTNSMREELVRVTGESEKAKGVLIGKQEMKAVSSMEIEKAAQLVADRVGDIVITRLFQDERFKGKEKETT